MARFFSSVCGCRMVAVTSSRRETFTPARCGSHKRLLFLLVLLANIAPAPAAPPPTKQPEVVREIFVPFEDLNVILKSGVRRVFMKRQQYEEMLARVRTSPGEPPPVKALVLSALYKGSLKQDRARITGTLQVDVLEDGLQQLPLRFSGVGIRAATLDKTPAPLARGPDGRIVLFVEGRGQHTLVLDLLAPLQASAAEQALNIQVPTPPSTKLQLVVPGNVEVKSGAAVVSRKLTADTTELELLPPGGPLSVVMSLNNRAAQTRQVVVARSVLVDEVTKAYERLHAQVSMSVLYGEAAQFRFALPDGFEVSQVESPLLAQWAVEGKDAQRVLTVKLREPAAGTVSMNIVLIKTAVALDDWQLPRLTPLDVAGQVAVVGLVAEERLDAEQITASGLITIENQVLMWSIPKSVLQTEPGAPAIRSIVTYFAPQADYGLTARFVQPPAQHEVVSNLMLTVSESELALRASFTVVPTAERLFELEIEMPKGWHVTSVRGADGQVVLHEQEEGDTASLLRIRVPKGAPVRVPTVFQIAAVSVPENWLNDWKQNKLTFPAFVVRNAVQDIGALAVVAQDDLIVRADRIEGLIPLNQQDRARYGLADVPTALAYFYDRQPYRASLTVERRDPWITARTYSFLTVLPDSLKAHYEVDFLVQQAGVRKLIIELPADTPDSISIQGMDGAALKEFSSQLTGGVRRWTVLLAQRRRGHIRLAVDFLQRLESEEPKNLPLPLIAAVDVAFQSGHVAVEGSPELDVQVVTTAREVDVGELSAAEYLPGPRLLGAYAYGGGKADIKINVFRHPGYGLPGAIIERAELVTAIGADGISQTVARYQLRTKASYLEIELPPGSSLWSAFLDGEPIKPQRESRRLLLSLPAKTTAGVRKLQVVFETPSDVLGLMGTVELAAPKLYLWSAPDRQRAEVPVADVQWSLQLPAGYRVASSAGTVFLSQAQQRPSPLAAVVRTLYYLAGGFQPFVMLSSINSARESSRRAAEDFAERERLSSGRGELTIEIAEDSDVDAFALDEIDEIEEMEVTTEEMDLLEEAEPSSVSAFGSRAYGGRASTRSVPPRSGKYFKSKTTGSWALEGLSSLQIDLPEKSAKDISFQSLGVDPLLRVKLIEKNRVQSFAAAIGLAILLVGLLLTRRPVGTKTRYLVAVILISSLVPLITGWTNQLGDSFDVAFFSACLLIPYYLFVGILRWFAHQCCGRRPTRGTRSVTAAILLLFITISAISEAAPPVIVQIAPPPEPVKIPRDAIIIPYNVGDGVGIDSRAEQAEKVLVPYDQYVKLWNQAHPDKKIEVAEQTAKFALSGGTFSARLEGDTFLLVRGSVDVDLFTDDDVVSVPLALAGGVLTEAELDGQPARLRFISAADPAAPNAPAQAPQLRHADVQKTKKAQRAGPAVSQRPQRPLVVLLASGKGRHRLDVAVRLPLERRGGWRLLSGNIPFSPATALTLEVPLAKTEIRMPAAADRKTYETTKNNETIETVLAAGGLLQIEWRPTVAEGAIDRTLTANSQAVFDVREDGLFLMWRLQVDFGRTLRDSFTIAVPKDYLLERIVGENVRNWQAKTVGDTQQVEITLLKASQGQQSVTIQLSQHRAVGQQQVSPFDVPNVMVTGAALHRGKLTVRRSPILQLQTTQLAGATRTDASDQAATRLAAVIGAEESPLGIQPYQTYRFVSTPFQIGLSDAQITAETSATVQSILGVAQRETTLESRIQYRVKRRKIFRLKIVLPEGLELNNRVRAPEPFQWSVAEEEGKRVLSIQLGEGRRGDFPVFIGGTIQGGTDKKTFELPQLSILGVDHQESDIVLQVDPAYEVRAANLQNCQNVLPQSVYSWLIQRQQRELARLVLRARNADYAGSLAFTRRQPKVTCRTITNTKITENTIEETILLDFSISDAGIRQVVFLLPESMQQARISAPQLRQTTVTPVAGKPLVRVQLDLQDDLKGQFDVKIVHDHLLTEGLHTAPIPVVQTGQTRRRFVVLENAGRDELVVEQQSGLEVLNRQQQQWRELATLLGEGLTLAYVVRKGSDTAELTFKTRERKAVETARASIGLARTQLVVDGSGAFRGVQEYRLDNETEQFLEIALPTGAHLWSATVAGEPVKPIEEPATGGAAKLQIPLIKTAKGDQDYAVILKYGGTLGSLGNLGTVGFPLIHTVNINVETSQVRLYLPKNHSWFDFGGDMKLVTEADHAAGQVAYNTRQLQKLAEVLSGDDDYARARAIANSSGLMAENNKLINQQEERHLNQELSENVDLNATWRDLVGDKLEKADVVDATIDTVDNRSRLDKAWRAQRNDRASNVVQDTGRNWNADGELKQLENGWRIGGRINDAERPVDRGFNEKWLEGNELDRDGISPEQVDEESQSELAAPTPAPAQQAGRYQVAQDPDKTSNKVGGKADLFADSIQKGQIQKSEIGGQGGIGGGGIGGDGGDSGFLYRPESDIESTKNNARRYQEKLEAQQSNQDKPGGKAGGRKGKAKKKRARKEGKIPEPAEIARADLEESPQDAALPTTGGPSIGGMASLEVTIPARGDLYLFTTPRGNAQISARTISTPLLDRLIALGWVVGVVVLALILIRWIRRGVLSALGDRRGSLILIVLGLASLLTCIFPFAGLLMIIAGLVIFFFSRRAAAV